MSAAEIETAVVDRVRALLRQPKIVVGTWIAAWEELPDLTENDVRKALCQLDPLWEQLFPAEQSRIGRLLVERVGIGPDGADIRLRVDGLQVLSVTWRSYTGPVDNAGMNDGAAHITVRVPLTVRHRSGRKTIVTLDGAADGKVQRRRADPAMVKALARAFRWKPQLEDGRRCSISEIAIAEKIDGGYVGNILRLTLLASDIVESILDGRQPPMLGLPNLLKPFPVEWDQQSTKWSFVGEQSATPNRAVVP